MNESQPNQHQVPAWQQGPPDWLGRAVLYVGLAAVLLYVSILLAPVWVLLFASVLIAIFLDGTATVLRERVFRNRLPSNQIAWVIATLVVLVAVIGTLGVLLGPRIADQAKALAEQLPKALERLRNQLAQALPVTREWLNGEELKQLLTPSSAAGQRIVQLFNSFVGALGSTAVVLVVGLYLAVQPNLYLRGCVLLVPERRVPEAQEVLRLTGQALRRWLLGRLSSMAAVFLLTTVALWILGSPLALSLGLLAGLLSFIPFLGPLLSAVPAILIGLMESQLQALWIAIAYMIVQLLESNLLTPLIQAYAVTLRPAILLGAQVIAGSLFGLPGVIIATPLAVALTVFVQVLYVRRHLGKDVRVLGESGDDTTDAE